MKNLFNILGFFLLAITIISCGSGEKKNSTPDVNELINVEEDSQNKDQIIKILKDTALFYVRCEEFECNIDNKLGNFTINQNPCVFHWVYHIFYYKIFRVIIRLCIWRTLQKDKVFPWFPRNSQLWRTGSGLGQCRSATNLPEIAKVT